MIDPSLRIKELLRLATDLLHEITATAGLDARLLLMAAADSSLEQLILKFDQTLLKSQQQKFLSLLERRLKSEPMAYILGYKEFYGRPFTVDQRVLIPRAETEIIIEAVIQQLQKESPLAIEILDLGTGSGAIAVTLALESNNATIVATDLDPQALELAAINVRNHKTARQVKLQRSDWYSELGNTKFDMIVSNPPYISSNEIHLMAAETKYFEPETALFAAADGLAAYQKIITGAVEHLKPRGLIFLELGHEQASKVQDILLSNCFEIISLLKDLQGFDRVVVARASK